MLSDRALCSLAALKVYLGHDPETEDDFDAALESLIEAVSAAAEAYTGRKLAAADYEWDISGDGTPVICAPEWPINSVAELALNGVALSPRASVTGSGYVLDAEAGCVELSGLGVFSVGIRNVHLAANAGYNPIPADLAQAAIEWATWKLSESGVLGVGGNKLGQTSVQLPNNGGVATYWSSGLEKSIPPNVRAILDLYARRSGL